ncbi:hypothetical protein Hanom_Chr10g00941411 [Helianthus anomalus]
MFFEPLVRLSVFVLSIVLEPFECTRNCIRWYQSFGFQMALREGECFLVRRVADRGIDKNIGGSRAREEDRRPVRRTADRGNDKVDSDSWDLKIKRLRQRIKRLRQRVRDLELRRETRIKETESGTIDWDDVNEEEEHPLCHTHPRFFEPIYQECLTDDEPDSSNIVWDESDDEEEAKYNDLNTPDNFDVFLIGEKLVEGGGVIATGDPTVVTGSPTTSMGTQSQSMVIPSFMPIDKLRLHVDPRFTGFQNGGDLIKSPKLAHVQKRNDIKMGEYISVFRDEEQFADNDIYMTNVHGNSTCGPFIPY